MASSKIGAVSSPDKMPATLNLTEHDLPAIKGWKIGGKYRIVLEVEEVRAGKGYDGEGPHDATFKVISASSAGESKKEESAEKPTSGMPGKSDKLAAINEKAKAA